MFNILISGQHTILHGQTDVRTNRHRDSYITLKIILRLKEGRHGPRMLSSLKRALTDIGKSYLQGWNTNPSLKMCPG